MVNFREEVGLSVKGHLKIVSVDKYDIRTVLLDQNNSITDQFLPITQALLGGGDGVEDSLVTSVGVGTGGDYNASGIYVGTRVAPVVTETELRVPLASVAIGQTTSSATGEWTYVAIARPEELVSDSIDEYGLLTQDGTMIAHIVEEAVPATGLAIKRSKKSTVRLIFSWTISMSVSQGGQ